MERTIGRDFGIQIAALPMGEDWVFLIRGGRAHIGAAAAAYPDGEAAAGTAISLPGHREAELAAEVAKKAAARLKRAAAVVMGIHIDDATRADIAAIVAEVHQRMELLLSELQSGLAAPQRRE